MDRLENTLVEYAWGSRTALAEFTGAKSPALRPQAEMWIGAHPSAPSRVLPSRVTLLERIREAPTAALGDAVNRRFQGKLPFLLKVLTADHPLSMQAHPDAGQAAAGYAREEAAGLPLTAPQRNYKDTNHKPELLCALGPFEALCGFRPAARTLELLDSIPCPALDAVRNDLHRHPGREGIRAAFARLMTMPAEERGDVVDAVIESCERSLSPGCAHEPELRCAVELAALYPGDVGAVSSLLLNYVKLEAGEAMYLPAGNVHSYLRGIGIEIMASSDNVLRAGLTPKHIDIPELLSIVDFRDEPFRGVELQPVDAIEREFRTGAADFRLSIAELAGGCSWRPVRRGPEILLCTRGEALLDCAGEQLLLRRGESAFVAASDAGYTAGGDASLARATPGELE